MDAQPPPVATDGGFANARERSFRIWSARTFAALIVLFSLGGLGVVLGSGDTPPVVAVFAQIGQVIAIVALIAIVAAAPGSSWWHPATVAVLWILVLQGIVIVLETPNGVRIPFAGIAAILVLWRFRPSLRWPAAGRDAWLALGLVALYLAGAAWPAVTAAAFRPGATPLAVAPEALDLRLSVDCSKAAYHGEIRVSVAWSWRARDVWPARTDGLVVRWGAVGSSDVAFLDQESSHAPDWMWSGAGSPAATLTQPIAGGFSVAEYGIDVEHAGLQDGNVLIVLRPADPEAAHGTVDVVAAYAHLDRWLRWSDNAPCAW